MGGKRNAIYKIWKKYDTNKKGKTRRLCGDAKECTTADCQSEHSGVHNNENGRSHAAQNEDH